MIYYTQLIFIKPGYAEVFHEFETHVLPLLKSHDGELISRVRPSTESFIGGTMQPYEIHVVRFPSKDNFSNYSNDPRRLEHIALKNESIESVILLEGYALNLKIYKMENYTLPIQIRWADIDANQHLRHSAYYDYGATIRMSFLAAHGLSIDIMDVFKIGPIIFREEAVFRREIKFEDKIILDAVLQKASRDYSRWTLQHHFYKADQQVAATITIDGAWIDLTKRKLALPNETMIKAFEAFPKAPDFQWMEKSSPKE